MLDLTKSGPSLVEIASSTENHLLLIEQMHRSSSSILFANFFSRHPTMLAMETVQVELVVA